MGDSELEGREVVVCLFVFLNWEVLLKHVSFEQRLKERWDLIRWGMGGLCRGEEQCHGLVCFEACSAAV